MTRTNKTTAHALPAHPLKAKKKDISACLGVMGTKPLKLIADQVLPLFNEKNWTQEQWHYKKVGGKIEERGLLPYPPDTFQFSVANEHSKQDFHCHSDVLEIYVSEKPIRVSYRPSPPSKELKHRDPLLKSSRNTRGAFIIPPGIWHRVKLSGLTWVFQVALGGGSVKQDKEV